MEVELSWKLLLSTRAWHSIWSSTQSPLHALLIPVLIGLCSYKNVLIITHVYPTCFWSSLFFCFVCHFEFSSGLPLYTSSQTPVPASCCPFLVLVTSETALFLRGIWYKQPARDISKLPKYHSPLWRLMIFWWNLKYHEPVFIPNTNVTNTGNGDEERGTGNGSLRTNVQRQPAWEFKMAVKTKERVEEKQFG